MIITFASLNCAKRDTEILRQENEELRARLVPRAGLVSNES
jgi:hypothetical protein